MAESLIQVASGPKPMDYSDAQQALTNVGSLFNSYFDRQQKEKERRDALAQQQRENQRADALLGMKQQEADYLANQRALAQQTGQLAAQDRLGVGSRNMELVDREISGYAQALQSPESAEAKDMVRKGLAEYGTTKEGEKILQLSDKGQQILGDQYMNVRNAPFREDASAQIFSNLTSKGLDPQTAKAMADQYSQGYLSREELQKREDEIAKDRNLLIRKATVSSKDSKDSSSKSAKDYRNTLTQLGEEIGTTFDAPAVEEKLLPLINKGDLTYDEAVEVINATPRSGWLDKDLDPLDEQIASIMTRKQLQAAESGQSTPSTVTPRTVGYDSREDILRAFRQNNPFVGDVSEATTSEETTNSGDSTEVESTSSTNGPNLLRELQKRSVDAYKGGTTMSPEQFKRVEAQYNEMLAAGRGLRIPTSESTRTPRTWQPLEEAQPVYVNPRSVSSLGDIISAYNLPTSNREDLLRALSPQSPNRGPTLINDDIRRLLNMPRNQ